MSGNTSGGLKAKRTVYRLYGKDFYSRIGSKGGKGLTGKKGFALMPKEKVMEASSKGGKNRNKGKKK